MPECVTVYFNEGASLIPATTEGGYRVHDTSDERRFALDVHAGRQRVFELVARRGA
jgi:hypothetical protein